MKGPDLFLYRLWYSPDFADMKKAVLSMSSISGEYYHDFFGSMNRLNTFFIMRCTRGSGP